MKILYFGGGLGNQIFEYSFYLSVKDRFPSQRIYGVYSKKRFKEHAGGLEIERIFNVNLPKSSKCAEVIMTCIMAWNKLVRPTKYYCHNLTKPNYDAFLFNAHKMVFECYRDRKQWISFKPIDLNENNKKIVELMLSTNSVSIYVRRGDFLSAKYAAKHAEVADEVYYTKAIEYIKNNLDSPKFFVFSDDIPWCRENLEIDGAEYIDWNTGRNSYIDMFLMTKTKANIIANSTFSYWSAFLSNKKKLVVFPSKWRHSEGELDIFPKSWIEL